ncbi:MAG TPA: hypothetical protein VKR06_41100 [Ktedonosporobacter sp.]|nr:hypothetical protein [Ktedonosporobacter sp.]
MKQRPTLLLLVPVLALALMVGLFTNPSSVRATSTSGVPTTGNLIYHGGPVMAGEMEAYAIFWEPHGSFVSPTYNKLLKRYLRDIGDSGLYENNEQYTNASGQAPADVELAGTFVDKSPYPSTPLLQDSAIRNEVAHVMSVKEWKPGITHLFLVYTALNEIICSPFLGTCSAPVGGSCGYHFGFGTPAGVVLYAALPYAGNALAHCYGLNTSPNHDIAADAEINITSHEQIEAATDPAASGWFGPGGLSDEIGDKCIGVFGPFNEDGADVSYNGHPYVVQEEWDNTAHGCVLSGPTNETSN